MQSKTFRLQSNVSKIGLKINVKKTGVMSLNTKQPTMIQLDENKFLSHTSVKSIVTNDDGAAEDTKAR